jgi:hypothetical protein
MRDLLGSAEHAAHTTHLQHLQQLFFLEDQKEPSMQKANDLCKQIHYHFEQNEHSIDAISSEHAPKFEYSKNH